jgi:hypothetical protein
MPTSLGTGLLSTNVLAFFYVGVEDTAASNMWISTFLVNIFLKRRHNRSRFLRYVVRADLASLTM